MSQPQPIRRMGELAKVTVLAPRPSAVLVYCRKIPISNNVGGVKHCLRTQQHALKEERRFALVDDLRFPTMGSLLIVGVENSVRPSHLFDHQLRS
jgi:hypothetical protein